MPHLVVVPFGSYQVRADGAALLPDKLVTGMSAYARRWPGEVTLVVRPRTEADGNMGNLWRDPADLPFHVTAADDPLAQCRIEAPDVVIGALEYRQSGLERIGFPVVWTAEFPVRERLRTSLIGQPRLARVPRIVAGGLRQGVVMRSMVRRAAGLQANGWPAYDSFRRLSPNPMLYFDTRLTREMIDRHARAPRPLPRSGTLRLGFSGRVFANKGPEFAVRLTNALNRTGVPATLTIFGDGPMHGQLDREDEGHLRWAGEIDFSRTWVSRVPAEIDLMVLPHIQGDPSGTYLETAGLGVPVLGFANAALRGLVEHDGLGWAVRTKSVTALVSEVIRLLERPHEVSATAERGIRFMREHHFDAEFDRRIDHLHSVAKG